MSTQCESSTRVTPIRTLKDAFVRTGVSALLSLMLMVFEKMTQ